MDFLRVVLEPGADYTEVILLPMCSRHAVFARDAMRAHPEAMEREKLFQWLQDNINPIHSQRLMRFISTAANNVNSIH